MRRICFIANSVSYGGAEKMMSFVANGLVEQKNDVYIINLLEHPDNAGRLSENITVIELRTNKIRYLDRVDQILKLIRIVRKIKPDVIISFTFRPNYLAAITGKILGIPVIISERCDPSRELCLKGRVKKYWELINSVDGGVFQTEGAMLYYSERMQKRGTIIPNPAVLNENIIHNVKDNNETKVIVSIGRLANAQKRYDIMLEAFKAFSQKNPNYLLKIYGDGEDEKTIRAWISEYGMNDTVSLEGKTNHPLQAMDTADIFLTTSDYEGISNSLLEAMAIGMPVVATDCSPGGAKLLIRDGENGLLVSCGNAEDIASALDRIANDYSLRRNCGEKARKVKKDYSPQKIMTMWADYIETVLATNQRKL